ncbi:hypothetical protein E2P64_06860 [Candidatus Bathyarchaeota archaeon]|nr:hypothetical protein E2P64_06860 [Candidatus Bathyarchaeota archaeon]
MSFTIKKRCPNCNNLVPFEDDNLEEKITCPWCGVDLYIVFKDELAVDIGLPRPEKYEIT